jgi:membrane associated rhomboid family serine protease
MVPIRYSNPLWATNFGLPPDGYLSFFTNLFLHDGWLHLIVNMWFLWIFADNIEDRMGHGRFIIFYLLCGFLATALQWYFIPELVIPVVGASGAIAGVLGAYFFIYPTARIIILIPLFFWPLYFEIPAIGFLGVWVIIQLHKATTAMVFENIAVDVAWWAHIGGFIAGSIIYRFFLLKNDHTNHQEPKQNG